MRRMAALSIVLCFCFVFVATDLAARDMIDFNAFTLGMSKDDVGSLLEEKYQARLTGDSNGSLVFDTRTQDKNVSMYYRKSSNKEAADVDMRDVSSFDLHPATFVFINDKLAQISTSLPPGDPTEFIMKTPPHKGEKPVKLVVEPMNAVQGMDSMLYVGKGDGFGIICYFYKPIDKNSQEQAPNTLLAISAADFEQQLRSRMKK